MQKLADRGHEAVSYDIADGENLFDLPTLESAVRNVDVVYHAAAEANLNNMRTLDGGRSGILCNVSATDNLAFVCAKHQ
jgi:hypothetical protein